MRWRLRAAARPPRCGRWRRPGRESGGTVLALAPTAVAAQALGDAIGSDADTLAKLTHALHTGAGGPAWMRRIDHAGLVIVDEAGMAGTLDLRAVIDYVTSRGGSVRLVGDDQQLAAVAAGGVLRDISREVGAVTLSELMRFTDPAEAAATVALRDGRDEALGFYLDRGRVHQYDDGTVVDAAFTAWQHDVAAGRTSVLLAYRVETVDLLNARARADRLSNNPDPAGRTVVLARGLHASAGDPIITRRNEPRLRLSATDWVKNGDQFTIDQVTDRGTVVATHATSGRRITLPADYVRAHVDLGYARTIHGAQGSTVDTCHTVLAGAETRQLLYVAASRGRHANHLYLTPAGDGEPHNQLKPEQASPVTAVEVLQRILDRDGAAVSARTEICLADDPALRLHDAAARYQDGVRAAAVTHLGPQRMQVIADAAETLVPGLSDEAAWPVLVEHLAVIDLTGDAPSQLAEAIARRTLDDADDRAAVLTWRLNALPAGGPLGWLPAIPVSLACHADFGPWLKARAARVTTLRADLEVSTHDLDLATAPAWARPFLPDATLLTDLAVWRATTGVTPDDLDPVGAAQAAGTVAVRRYRAQLTDRVDAHLGRQPGPGAAWRPHLEALTPEVLTDPWWPTLGGRLDQAAAGGVDVNDLLAAATRHGPLPVEHTAAALWFRIAPTLGAAATTLAPGPRLRPAWTDTLGRHLPDGALQVVMTDPAWPVLVATIDQAQRAGALIDRLLADAAALTRPDSDPASPAGSWDQLATVLTWRVTALLHPPPDPHEVVDRLYDPEQDHAASTARTGQGGLESTLPADSVPTAEDAVQPHVDDLSETVAPEAMPRTSRARIIQLNEQAMGIWERQYVDSPAAGYIRGRLGTDLRETAYRVGYASPGWSSLTQTLLVSGASEQELVDAGLARWSRRGSLIDVFRDRVVFAVHDTHDGALVGFTARANPAAGPGTPKYLNTPTTDAFVKGEQLFGWAETATQRTSGAQAARTEGALDAIAVTLAGDGRVYGVAPLGTALTTRQAETLSLACADTPLLVATDADTAGIRAAEKDFWTLTSLGVAAEVLQLSPGTDPAAGWQADPDLLRQALTGRHEPLAHALVTGRVAELDDGLRAGHVESRVFAARHAAGVIATQPATDWDRLVTAAATAIDVAEPALRSRTVELVYGEVITRAIAWSPNDGDHDRSTPSQATAAQTALNNIAQQLRQQRHSPEAETAIANITNDIQGSLQAARDRNRTEHAGRGARSTPARVDDAPRQDRQTVRGPRR